jgi:hypothetical protein
VLARTAMKPQDFAPLVSEVRVRARRHAEPRV